MGSTRRNLRELRALLRSPETGTCNLAEYVATHEAKLGVDGNEMTGPDEVVAPRLLATLERRRAEERRTVAESTIATVRQLQSEARWHGEEIVLPRRPFFRLASPATGKKYIRFVGTGVDVTVQRQLLQRANVALRAFRDVSASVDGDGVHVRWGARGRLNFYAQELTAAVDAVVVQLPPRTVSRTMPALLGEVLAEMGFGS